MPAFFKNSQGWLMGIEPTTNGTTIRYSNQLSYSHHIERKNNEAALITKFQLVLRYAAPVFQHALTIPALHETFNFSRHTYLKLPQTRHTDKKVCH